MKWPESLIRDIGRRKVVLFLGAGISMNSQGNDGVRPPSWKEFLDRCVDRCEGDTMYVRSLIANKDYLAACEILKIRLGNDWGHLLSECFVDPQYRPADIHKHLFALDVSVTITQNFDKIYDLYAQRETFGSVKVKNYYDADTAWVLRRNDRVVIKAHGSIDEHSKMIFTREDYSVLRNGHQSFNLLLDALFLTHTFLFVGCGLDDPDLKLFLEKHAFAFPSAAEHYMTVPEDEINSELENSIKRNLNIRALAYSPNSAHKELSDSIVELAALVDDERLRIASQQDW